MSERTFRRWGDRYDNFEALQLLGPASRIEVASVVDPQYSVACRLERKYLQE
jgi:amidase